MSEATPKGILKVAITDFNGDAIPGGGSAVSIADGADVAEGTKADAAWDGIAASATVVSILKKIATSGASAGLTDAQLRASAVPVSLASTTITGSVAVTGPLTDTQLRASAVPVSGTFFQATQPVSAAALPLPSGASTEATLALLQVAGGTAIGALKSQLASAVAATSAPSYTDGTINPLSQTLAGALRVAGTVTATGPLTDTQLRASAVPVQGPILDNAPFTDGTTPVMPAGYILDEVAGTALTENDVAAARIDSKRAQIMVMEDSATAGRRVRVAASSTAAAATDPSFVVALSPNSPPTLTAEGTAFASASRGVATVTFDVTNAMGKGIQVFTDLTVLGASSTVTVTIQGKDPVSGKFFTLLAGTAISTVSSQMLTVYPGLTAAAGSVATQVVPRSIRISVAVAVAASTFSVGYSLIP